MGGMIYSIQIYFLSRAARQGFDYIIKGYFKNRIGHSYIERGDYHVLRTQDSQIIPPEELASSVEPGMVMEMSIIMRQTLTVDDKKRKTCPRCQYVNSSAGTGDCWIEW